MPGRETPGGRGRAATEGRRTDSDAAMGSEAAARAVGREVAPGVLVGVAEAAGWAVEKMRGGADGWTGGTDTEGPASSTRRL